MSNRYAVTLTTSSAPAAGAAFAELRTGSRGLFVEELSVVQRAATATGIGLVRATTVGVAGTASTPQPENPAMSAAAATLVLGPTTAPIFTAANAMRRTSTSPVIGGGVIWGWPGSDRLFVPPSSALVLYNCLGAAGAAAIDVFAVFTEI